MVRATDDIEQQSMPSQVISSGGDCQVSDAAIAAIEEAKAAGYHNWQSQVYLRNAEAATGPLECNSTKAKHYAEQAIQISKTLAQEAETRKSELEASLERPVQRESAVDNWVWLFVPVLLFTIFYAGYSGFKITTIKKRLSRHWDLILPYMTAVGGFIATQYCLDNCVLCDIGAIACLGWVVIGIGAAILLCVVAVIRTWIRRLGTNRLVALALLPFFIFFFNIFFMQLLHS